jgi:hypothetical protein
VTPENSVVDGADTSTDQKPRVSSIVTKKISCTTSCEDVGRDWEDAQVLRRVDD